MDTSCTFLNCFPPRVWIHDAFFCPCRVHRNCRLAQTPVKHFSYLNNHPRLCHLHLFCLLVLPMEQLLLLPNPHQHSLRYYFGWFLHCCSLKEDKMVTLKKVQSCKYCVNRCKGRKAYFSLVSSSDTSNIFSRFFCSLMYSPCVKWVLNAKCFETISVIHN